MHETHLQEEYWDSVADKKEFPTPFQIVEFEKYVSPEMRILDVGCGYGRTLNELHNNGFKHLNGVDFSQKMINRGLRLYPYLNLTKNNGDELPFPSGQFDAVILIGVLTSNFTNKEQEKIISEISRVIKSRGILYLSDFLLNDDERNIKRYNEYKDIYGIYGVFKLPEGAVLRHHHESHISKLTKDFEDLILKKTVYRTMNGNKSKGFYYIGKKK